jgi:hypothetical protein
MVPLVHQTEKKKAFYGVLVIIPYKITKHSVKSVFILYNQSLTRNKTVVKRNMGRFVLFLFFIQFSRIPLFIGFFWLFYILLLLTFSFKPHKINYSEKLFQGKHDFIIDNVIINFDLDAKIRYLNGATKYRLRMLIAICKALSDEYKEAIIQTNEIIKEINTEYKE